MWSLGVLVGGPVAVVLLLVSIALVPYSVRVMRRNDTLDWFDGPGWGVGFGVAGMVGVLVVSAIAYWPYSHDYHYWSAKSGVVAAVNKRVLTSDSSIDQRFVVRFADAAGQEYACDDTRCALVKAGDRLELSCKRHWQYSGRDGWDCNYLSSRKGPHA